MQVPGYFPEPGPNSPRLLPALNVPVPLSWRDEPDEHEVQENRLREQYQSFISNELNSNARKQGLKQFVTSYRTAIVKCLLDSAYMGGNALYKLNKNGDLARAWRWTSALDEHLALYKVDGTFSCQNFLIPLYAAYRRDMTKWTLLLDTLITTSNLSSFRLLLSLDTRSVADSNEAGIYMLQPPLKYSKTPLPHLADLDTLDCIENSPSSVPLFLGMSQNFRDCFSNSLREPVNARMAAKFKEDPVENWNMLLVCKFDNKEDPVSPIALHVIEHFLLCAFRGTQTDGGLNVNLMDQIRYDISSEGRQC